MYRAWPRFVGRVEVCPVQLPGRENRFRDPLFTSYGELAGDMLAALEPYLDRPFAFFGHCGSALPGYEASVQLAARGGPVPSRLFVSSQVAPHQGPFGRFLVMSDEELKEEVKTLFVQMGGNPIPDMLDMALQILLSDIAANRRYRPAAPVRLPCPITAIGWSRDAEVDARLMVGWSDCGETTFRTFDGVHYEFLGAPAALLAAIEEDLVPAPLAQAAAAAP
jgi:surfactin synthase thioesterase subunit